MPKSRACGVLVVRGNPLESFLLMEHSHRWDLPKGHVDDGETDIECALRELKEETGIRKKDIELDPQFRFEITYPVTYKKHPGKVFQKTVVYFLGRLLNDVKIELTEHPGYRWFAWNPPHMIQTKSIDPLLAAVEDYLKRRTA